MEQNNYNKVLEVFFNNPIKKFHIREISRITNLNPNTVLNISKKLLKKGLIKKEKQKHIVELYAVFDEKFKRIKAIANLFKIGESGLINFLNEKYSPESISVVGSYAKGEDIETSDIDIVVISKRDYQSIDLSKFERFLNRKIHLIITYYNKMSNEFYINLINGVVLLGYITKK